MRPRALSPRSCQQQERQRLCRLTKRLTNPRCSRRPTSRRLHPRRERLRWRPHQQSQLTARRSFLPPERPLWSPRRTSRHFRRPSSTLKSQRWHQPLENRRTTRPRFRPPSIPRRRERRSPHWFRRRKRPLFNRRKSTQKNQPYPRRPVFPRCCQQRSRPHFPQRSTCHLVFLRGPVSGRQRMNRH